MTLSRGLRVALAGSLLASAWVALQPDDTPTPAPRPASRPGPVTAGRAAERASALPAWPVPLQRDARTWPAAKAQALAAWGPPPPPPAPPVPPPTIAAPTPAALPQAPPFPYTLIGQVHDGSQAQAVLTGPSRTLGVKRTDVIDGQWRVEEIRPDGLSLTWLPGGQRQTLAYRPS